MASADFNGDGKLDLVVGNEADTDWRCFWETATGLSYLPIFMEAMSRRDGKPDLAGINYNSIAIVLNTHQH